MDTSLSWIKAYVPDLDCTAQEYTDAMTLSGTKVEGFTEFDKNLDKIIVGKINKIEKHPDADKLVICQVQINEEGEEVQIVTGAANVKEGDKVPVVLTADMLQVHTKMGKTRMVLRSKGKTAWRRIIRNDVFDRRVRIYDGHVSGCSQRRNLYFKRQSGVQRCTDWIRCNRTAWITRCDF